MSDLLATHVEAGYRFRLYSNGNLVVGSDKTGEHVETVCASMTPHADDIATYADAWLEDLRCLMADYKRFG